MTQEELLEIIHKAEKEQAEELDLSMGDSDWSLEIFVVNDGSEQKPNPVSLIPDKGFSAIASVNIIHMRHNVGHQRAIATGLCHVFSLATGNGQGPPVLVMDADGEDRPQAVPSLLKAHLEQPEAVIVAGRSKRTEPLWFKMGYWLYKLIFRLLTGRPISFGNFMLIPHAALGKVVTLPELWMHLASTIIKSRAEILSVKTDRGVRYAGQTKMNLETLVILGLEAVSVFSNLVFVRLLLLFLILGLLSASALFVVVGIRLFTDLAIPGWATDTCLALSSLFVQSVISSLLVMFLILRGKQRLPSVPILDAERFVGSLDTIFRSSPDQYAHAR